MESNKIYNVRVNNYSLPSFVSGDMYYYGTKQEIMNLLKNGEKSRADIIMAAEEYFSGKGPGKVSLFGEEPMPIINPVKLIGEAVYKRSNFNYKFFNIFQCDTDISIEHIEAHLIYIKDNDNKYKRCVKAKVKNAVTITSFTGEVDQIADSPMGYWGYPGFIVGTEDPEKENQFTLENTVYFVDTIFKNKQQVRKDMRHPHKPYLREFFLGIYGDG